MSQAMLEITVRRHVGKKIARHLRRAGDIPGIYYIRGEAAVPVSVNEKALRTVVLSKANLVDLNFNDGRKAKSVIREIQWDPMTSRPLHVDLMGIKLTEKITIEVPIRLIGSAAGVKEGGTLQVMLRELEIECLPLDIPDEITIDVSGMNIHDAVHVSDIKLEKVKILNDPEQVITSVLPPRIEETPVVEPTEEVAEPEVIGHGKKEEAEAEPAEGKSEGKSKEKEKEKK